MTDAQQTTQADRLLTSFTDISTTMTHRITGLDAASRYTVRITTYDEVGNESLGVRTLAATLLNNPEAVNGTAYSGAVDLTWQGSTPYDLIDHYAIYVETTDYNDVSGLTPFARVSRLTIYHHAKNSRPHQ